MLSRQAIDIDSDGEASTRHLQAVGMQTGTLHVNVLSRENSLEFAACMTAFLPCAMTCTSESEDFALWVVYGSRFRETLQLHCLVKEVE